jgi:hypothetical protein
MANPPSDDRNLEPEAAVTGSAARGNRRDRDGHGRVETSAADERNEFRVAPNAPSLYRS